MTVGNDDQDPGYKLHDLRCFDQVVRHGSFQAAARALHRTHPSVFAAVARLEAAIGVTLLDRSGYRVALTAAGRSFHEQATVSLGEFARLSAHARLLAQGDEPVLRVVLGDLCPRPVVLDLLAAFFGTVPATRLHLDYEAVGGPLERLRSGSCDLVFHRAECDDTSIERIVLGEVALIPVAAPGYLPHNIADDLAPDRLRPFTQCVIRDTARDGHGEDHFLIDGGHRCSVADHAMKRELILCGMGWGHVPDALIGDDLATGRLVRIKSRCLPGKVESIAALRRIDRLHGPVGERLWRYIAEVASPSQVGDDQTLPG